MGRTGSSLRGAPFLIVKLRVSLFTSRLQIGNAVPNADVSVEGRCETIRSGPGPIFDRALRAGVGCLLRRLLACHPESFNLQSLIHVKALFAVQTLYELSSSFSNGSGNAGGIDFDRAPLGASTTVFIIQRNAVRIHGSLS